MSETTIKRIVFGVAAWAILGGIAAAVWLGPFHGPNDDITGGEQNTLILVALGPGMVLVAGVLLWLFLSMGWYALTGKGDF